MVKFWVGFAFLVAAISVLSNCDSVVAGGPFTSNFTFGNGGGERGSGVEKSETRQVGAFRRIHVQGAGTLDLTVGADTPGGTLEIAGDDNLLAFLRTEVSAGTLEIGPTVNINPQSRIHVKVAAATLEGVHLEGANKMNLTLHSTQPFDLHIEGAGRVSASGKVPRFTVHSEGAGNVDAADLVAGTVDVHIEGAGRAKVNATDAIKAHIEGAGVITYRGEPKMIEKDIEGIGRVTKAE